MANFLSSTHESYPFKDMGLPIQQREDDEYGRYLVASRTVTASEVVLMDEAVVIAPDFHPVCLGCYKSIENLDHWCQRCHFPLCEVSCESSGSMHALLECPLFHANHISPKIEDIKAPHFIYNAIGILRLLILQQKGSISHRFQSHSKIRLESQEVHEAWKKLTTFFQDRLQIQGVNIRDVKEAYGVFKTNAVAYQGRKASALYPLVSLCSHSCVPNLESTLQSGTNIEFKAIRQIQEGEQLTINYLPLIQHRLTLRRQLEEKWLFQCQCQRCQDGTDLGTFLSSPLCPSCQTAFSPLVPQNALDLASQWHCSKCNHAESALGIKELDIKASLIESKAVKNGNPEMMLSAIKELEQNFSPNYHSIIKLKNSFINHMLNIGTQMSQKRCQIAISFCSDLLRCLRALENGKTRHQVELMKSFIKFKLIEKQCT